jgi:hypothetical protein
MAAIAIEIVITPLGYKSPGRFEVRLGDRPILKSSRQPLLDAARVLAGEGVSPDTRIAIRDAGANHVALSSTIGTAARLTVAEHNGTVFAKWKPHPRSAVPPHVRFGDDQVPRIALEAGALCDETAGVAP